MLRTFILSIIILLFSTLMSYGDETSVFPDIELIQKDVTFLASDELEGRFVGTSGIEMAAGYITESFMNSGLVPAFDDNSSYTQEFEITTEITMGEPNTFSVTSSDGVTEFTLREDFMPLFVSSNGNVEGEIAFAGYGITAPEYEWDDYDGIDVSNKIVFCYRGEPDENNPDSIFNGKYSTIHSDIRVKTQNAINHGAAGLILMTNPENIKDGDEDHLIQLNTQDKLGELSIPVVQVSQDTGAVIFNSPGLWRNAPLLEIEGEMLKCGLNVDKLCISINVNLVQNKALVKNIAGIIMGKNPALSWQYVLIGAHYDHIGWGNNLSKFESSELMIHNGADDNASGVGGLLALARMFSASSEQMSRSIIFVCFSAEEQGTVGSKYFVKNSPVPLEYINAMINMDMIGRAVPAEDGIIRCLVQGAGSANGFGRMIENVSNESVNFIAAPNPIGGSDYTEFYNSSVPCLNFFSGIHDDYHTPFDDSEKINYDGMALILKGIYQIASSLANMPFKLAFNRDSDINLPSGGVDSGINYCVYLGTIPDFSHTEGGFWISGVREGSPAEIGGILPGDQIIRMGNYEVSDIYNYTWALGQFLPGDTTEIVVLRNGTEIVLQVTFTARDNSDSER